MTPRSTGLTLLALAFALTSPAAAQDLEIGIDTYDVEDLEYRDGTATNRRSAAKLKDALGSELKGDTRTRRAKFTFEHNDSGAEFDVRGILYGWDNLIVERYKVGSLGEAVWLTDHEREEDDKRVIEARGKDVLIISGAAMDDPAVLAKARELAWPASAQKRIDVLALQESENDLYYRFSEEALDASPDFKAKFEQQDDMLEMLANMDPSATLTVDGDRRRMEIDGEIFTLDERSMGLFSNAAKEAEFLTALSALDPSIAAPSGADSGGIAGALGGSTGGSGAAPAPDTLTEGHDGETFRMKVGDLITVKLRGNPSTGYMWRPRPTSKLDLVYEDFFGPGAGGPVGSGGSFVFDYKAETPGTETVTLRYARGSGSVAETFEVTIVVE
jgi:predicted secreted protein